MSKEEDILLINQFINGNIPAFDKLVLKYKNIVFNLCFKILYNYEDAEDCSQEVFIKVYNAIKTFKFNSSFKTWLYTIALNTLPDKYKILVILKDIEEKSYDEIVTMTGLKIGTVKSILFRAREKLRVK